MPDRPPLGHEVATVVQDRGNPARPRLTFALMVIAGADRGARFAIDGEAPSPLLVGQSPACDVRLNDALVSRRHAALDPGPRELRVTDLRSTNRTYVNGLSVVEAHVGAGDVLRLGATELRVEASEAPPSAPPADRSSFGRMFGESAEMRRLYPLCDRLASARVPVLIEGETGTGKEVLAEALHEAGARAAGPFIVFDCTTVAPTLIESALFGHERGAFTGAMGARRGVFEQAHGGTLFLDEIGDLDLVLQAKLLRAVERAEVCRVGSERWHRVDVRIIAATRRDLEREVQAGRFRDDLFYRLGVARLQLPPLRRRGGDVGALARRFWHELGGKPPLPYELFERYEDYLWPGNVRELYNAVARRLALGDLDASFAANAPPPAAASPNDDASRDDTIERILARDLPLTRARQQIVEAFERRYLERVLARHGGNVTRAAEAAGIARRYFHQIRARLKP